MSQSLHIFFHIRMKKISRETTLDVFVESYIKGDTSVYGTWYENVGSWLGGKVIIY